LIYFAYGADLNPGRMVERAPGYRTIGVARLDGYWLGFPRSSALERTALPAIVPDPGGAVWGALYEVPKEDVPILHHLHGFDPDGPAGRNDHDFLPVEVTRPGQADSVRAVTYVPLPDGTSSLPSAAYMAMLIEGARYHGLPRTYLAALQSIRTA